MSRNPGAIVCCARQELADPVNDLMPHPPSRRNYPAGPRYSQGPCWALLGLGLPYQETCVLLRLEHCLCPILHSHKKGVLFRQPWDGQAILSWCSSL